MELKYLVLEKNHGVACISFNRPKELNTLNSEMLSEIDEVLDVLSTDDEVNVLLFTGLGKAFIAGADVSEMADFNGEKGRKFAMNGQRIFRKLELMEKPSIAAINGYAIGGGCEFAMACDIRIAGERAKLGQPEVGLGITPGFAGTQRLARLVGEGRAKELIFTGDLINAKEAESIGLVNKVFEDEILMEECLKLAQKIAAKAQLAVRYSKIAINKGLDIDLDSGNEIEASYFGLCFTTEDQKEGMNAFLTKRKPDFKTK